MGSGWMKFLKSAYNYREMYKMRLAPTKIITLFCILIADKESVFVSAGSQFFGIPVDFIAFPVFEEYFLAIHFCRI